MPSSDEKKTLLALADEGVFPFPLKTDKLGVETPPVKSAPHTPTSTLEVSDTVPEDEVNTPPYTVPLAYPTLLKDAKVVFTSLIVYNYRRSCTQVGES